MRSLTRFFSLFRNLSGKPRKERELAQELNYFIDLLAEEKVRGGMDPQRALREARLELGGAEQVKEQVRDVRAGAWLETVVQDLRYGIRGIRKNPGFSALVVLTLALGIGANTAIFSAVYGVLLRPLPYERGGQLVVLHQEATRVNVQNVPFSVKEMADYRNYSHTLDGLVEYHSMVFLLLGGDRAERVNTAVVSANFFEVLGVKPLMGRSFLPSDESDNADPVLILSYQYWHERHGSDPNIVGKVFQMNNRPHTVIGVLPEVPQYPAADDVYMTTNACPFRSSAAAKEDRTARLLTVFGRLKSGATLQQARSDLSTVASQVETANPEAYPKGYGYGVAAAPLQEELTRRARTTLLVLLGAAGFVLLIACANVANLLLARLLKRERELAVRSALGASKSRLVRQLLTEAVLLSVTGGLAGLLLAYPVLSLLVRFAAQFTTRAAEVKMDAPVLIFSTIVSVLSGLLLGVVPALSSGEHVSDALKQGNGQATTGRRGQRLRSGLVVLQVAVSFMLLIGAGLMIRSFVKLQSVDPGFSSSRLLTMRLTPNFTRLNGTGTPAQRMKQQMVNLQSLSDRVMERIRAIGGVESAALATNFPFSPSGIVNGPGNQSFQIEGRPIAKDQVEPLVDPTYVGPGYFETIRQPILEGRTFTDHDDADSPKVGVINQTMARHRWPNEDPVGKRVTFDRGTTWITVVGVVGDVREYGLDHPVGDEFYTPAAQTGFAGKLVVRTAIDPASVLPLVQGALRSVDAEIAVDEAETIERLQYESLASPRVTTMLLGIFAGLALLISASGIGGIMALAVSQRTRELGIRMALGQPRNSVMGMVMRQGVVIAVVGTAAGILGALALGRLLSSLLYATKATDALTFVAVSLMFLAVAAIASTIPASRVTRIDPVSALRQE